MHAPVHFACLFYQSQWHGYRLWAMVFRARCGCEHVLYLRTSSN